MIYWTEYINPVKSFSSRANIGICQAEEPIIGCTRDHHQSFFESSLVLYQIFSQLLKRTLPLKKITRTILIYTLILIIADIYIKTCNKESKRFSNEYSMHNKGAIPSFWLEPP